MKKEYLILLGVLALSGGVAYFYFRKTSKELEAITPENTEILKQIKMI